MSTLLLSAVLGNSPCEQLVLKPADGPLVTWAPIALNLIQFMCLAGLTYYIFARGSRQRVAERKAKWYHKIVVDHCVEALREFFRDSETLLCGCSLELSKIDPGNQPEKFDQLIQGALANFKAKLHAINMDASGRISFFDEATTKLLLARVDKFEDDVAAWFDQYKKSQPFDHRTSLPRLLTKCQNELLEIIMNYEFSTWG